MAKVTLPKTEYERLVEKALRYDYLRQLLREDLFVSPPTRNVKKIVESFKKTGLYNNEFLRDLEGGLKRSSYFKV